MLGILQRMVSGVMRRHLSKNGWNSRNTHTGARSHARTLRRFRLHHDLFMSLPCGRLSLNRFEYELHYYYQLYSVETSRSERCELSNSICIVSDDNFHLFWHLVYRTAPSTCQPAANNRDTLSRFFIIISHTIAARTVCALEYSSRVSEQRTWMNLIFTSYILFRIFLFSIWMPLGRKSIVSRVFYNKINPSIETASSVNWCSCCSRKRREKKIKAKRRNNRNYH